MIFQPAALFLQLQMMAGDAHGDVTFELIESPAPSCQSRCSESETAAEVVQATTADVQQSGHCHPSTVCHGQFSSSVPVYLGKWPFSLSIDSLQSQSAQKLRFQPSSK